MDLRTKLVFGLVAVSLGSMLALGAMAYRSAEALLANRSTLRLASLADAKSEQVEAVVEGWSEAVGLIASRTQLRQSLVAWNQTEADADRSRIEQILSDVHSSSGFVEAAAVFDGAGRFVAGIGIGEVAPPELDGWDADVRDGVVLGGFSAEDPTRVTFAAALTVEGERIGILRTVLSTSELAEVAANYTGLGQTGETLIAIRDRAGQPREVTARRHGGEAPSGTVLAGSELLAQALEGVEGPLTEGQIDYRGQSIWAAMRRVEGAGLGVVVKLDEAEELADVEAYRARILGVGFSISAFAILLGVLMGLRFAEPIHALAGVANRIREGDLSARADEAREDELGLLASTFNDMSDELERRLSQLQEYKTFFDASRDMLCIAGTDGYFKRVNPAFGRTLGWSEEKLLETPFMEFVHPDDVEATVQEVERLAQGIPTISFDNKFRCADGSYKRLHWTAHPDPATGVLYSVARIRMD